MTRQGKTLLLSFFAVCALAAYGVYWWHEVVLDELAVEQMPYGGDLLIEIERYMVSEPPDRPGAEKRLLEMPEWDRDRIVAALAMRPEKEFRLLAIAVARRLRDRPIPRAVLARLTLDDPETKVKEAARRALGGEPP